MKQKRVAAIHDISCVGKCSLTVALPILSCAGIEACVVPTAVLSTHTGGFTGYTYRDLTDELLPIVTHWKTLGLTFDAVYTGYLGSIRQVDIVSSIFDQLRGDGTLIVVDPVMADHGKLYSHFGEDFPAEMKKLCTRADLIVPNMTEACLLTGRTYTPGPYRQDFIEELLQELSHLGPDQIVLTGVAFEHDSLGAACYDRCSGTTSYAFSSRVEGVFHGTGDIFAATLTASLLSGHCLSAALQTAVDFTACSINRTQQAGTDPRFGVNFEAGLCALSQQLAVGCD